MTAKYGKVRQPLRKVLSDHEDKIHTLLTCAKNVCDQLPRLPATGLEVEHRLVLLDIRTLTEQLSDEHGGETWIASRHDRSRGETNGIFRFLHISRPEQDLPVTRHHW